MQLKRQVFVFILLAAIMSMAGVSSALRYFIYSEFSQLEQQHLLDDSQRVKKLIQKEIDQIAVQARDWAVWDDSYQFIRDKNSAYIASNITLDTLKSMAIDYILYFNPEGQLVFSTSVDSDQKKLQTLNEEDKRAFQAMLTQQQVSKNSQGILATPNQPVMFAIENIYPSSLKKDAPSRGYLIFARKLNQTTFDHIADLNHQHIQIKSTPLPTDEINVNAVDDDKIQAAFNLYDYQKTALFQVVLTHDREIYQQTQSMSNWVLLITLVLGLFIALSIHLIINHMIIKKITTLRSYVQSFTEDKRNIRPVPIAGKTEIAELGRDFNGLMQTIYQHEQALEKSRFEAEQASRSKSEFIANMSHELRTPMTAILGFTSIMKVSGLNEQEQQENLDIIETNGLHLLALINEILDIAKIESGNIKLEKRDISLEKTLNEVQLLMGQQAHQSSLELHLNYCSTIPETITTDGDKLKQILINLVGNAIKFTPSGHVEMNINSHPQQQELEIAIKDSGIGISKEALTHIFEPFYQDESSSNRQFQGTGLGLSISQTLSKQLDFRISVESQINQGTTFSLFIPFSDDTNWVQAQNCAQKLQAFTPEKNLSGKVLIIDDNPMIGLLACKILSSFGLQAVHELNSLEAVNQLMKGHIKVDLILMDMQMPILDGYTATTRLKAANCPTPIIAITANSMSGDREKCLAAGCDDFLSKPIEQRALYERCQYFLTDTVQP